VNGDTDAMREYPDLSWHGTADCPRTPPDRPGAHVERALLDRVVRRDLQAFEQLYRIYQPRLARFLINLVNRPQLVEEVLNDTMTTVWQTADRFRGASKLSTWIFAIAYRKAIRIRRRWPEPVDDETLDSRVSDDPGPDKELNHRRLHDALVVAMGNLSPDHRAVVDLTYFHGLGYREIAEVMGCPISTVKTRMFHARRRLKRAFPGNLNDWL
jgi:RNA polymerase sigma factor (sigma-70 family)